MAAEAEFPAMGGTARLVVAGPRGLVALGRGRIEFLERRWSRFLPDSELCRINGAGGAPVVVSRETAAVIALAVHAHAQTNGAFDPTLLADLMRVGYDRTFDAIVAGRPVSAERVARSTSCADISVDVTHGVVQVPADLLLDLGGIGKGATADDVAALLSRSGAAGAAVSIGGDVRVTGCSPDGEAWLVGIDAPDGSALSEVAMADGGVATTTSARRRWTTATGEAHHVLDPSRGEPVHNDLVQVSVIAGTGAWAEVYAKAAFVAGLDAGVALLERVALCGLFVDTKGVAHRTRGFEVFER